MANPLKVTLFGSPTLSIDGQRVTGFRSSKAQALLYYLAVTGRPHTRSMLAGLFWGDQPEAAARTSLSKCLSNLRDLVGETVLVDRQTVAFNRQQPYHLDTEGFLAGIGQPPTPETLPTWQAALALYRGDFLEGFYVREAPDFEQWGLVQRAYYREAVLQGLHTLANYTEQGGDLPQAITYTRRLLTLEPWREEAHRQLMTRLARSGQRAAALAQFETCRQVLVDELGVEPDAETIAVVEVIRAGKFDKVSAPDSHPVTAPISGTRPPHPVMPTLPVPPTPLIGRERELAELGELISNPQCRLITLTGTGGMGKTRLALAVAAEQSGSFQHGAVFVPLAGVSSAQFLPEAILSALNIPLQGTLPPQQQVRHTLYTQECLLVLDNYEHLLPDVELLLDILHYAPNITLLVTARERLALQAEHLYELTGLTYPPTQTTNALTTSSLAMTDYAAIELFLQRTRQMLPRFTPTDAEMATIVRICQVSEGMPLALELAAALVRERPLAEIADKLAEGSHLGSNRLRGLPERHRSIWRVFEYSWRLLSPGEQRVFCSLSVFRGGFQAEAAQAVVNTSLEMLALLVDKSLLRQQRRFNRSVRYDMHELLRQFANKKLDETGEQETIFTQHNTYFLGLAEAAKVELHGSQQKVWLDRLEDDHNNLRAALNRCLIMAPQIALGLAAALWEFWYLRGYFTEGRTWLTQALSNRSTVPSVTTGIALVGASRLAWIQGDYDQATSLATEGLNLSRSLNDIQNVARAFNVLGLIAMNKNEMNQACLLFEQALTLRRELGNQVEIAGTLLNFGVIATYQNYLQAKSLLQESLAISLL
ncbi:MAG: BTAD domain-containing putative transcriptional regulator [Caldilineaceae bacterium]